MPFIETNKTLDDFLLDQYIDYINPWVTVHDEVDYTVPRALLRPIMKNVIPLVSLKDFIDKFGLPGLAMSYDVEFDPHNSWTASDSVDIYEYPLNHLEHNVTKEHNEIKKLLEKETKVNLIEIPSNKITEDLLKQISTLPNGCDQLYIVDGSTKFVLDRLVDATELHLS